MLRIHFLPILIKDSIKIVEELVNSFCILLLKIQDIVTEEDTESSSDYEEETSGDEDSGGGSQSGASMRPGIDLEIGATLKRVLEQDYELINNKNKVRF